MKLKYLIQENSTLKTERSNRTFMELKYDKGGPTNMGVTRSNRTFMELKWRMWQPW